MRFQLLDKQYLLAKMHQLKFKDPIIFEKALNVFVLLLELLKYYPNLIFKGGTALLLHKFPPVRFSIDIDIILGDKSKNSLSRNLRKLVDESELFQRIEEDVRKSDIPKVHHKFYYNSKFTGREEYVLLDVVFCTSPYYQVIEKSLHELPLFPIDQRVEVRVPTPEGLFGDKLTAISPKTIGIPLNKERDMEFVKQVIDLGILFDLSAELKDIIHTFKNNSKAENRFRNSNYSQEEILDSVLDVSFKYSQFLLKGSNDRLKVIGHLNDGLRKVSNHLVEKYGQNDLKLSFSKIAYICSILKKNDKAEIIKDVDFKTLEGKRLKEDYRVLESLRKTNPQAYFYWILGYRE